MASRRACTLSAALLGCLALTLAPPGSAQEPARAPSDLAALEAKILAARTITDATIPALDLVSHVSHPDREEAARRVEALLRKKGLPALALLKAMEAREVAWSDVVPGVLVVLGNGDPEVAAAAESLVRKVWLKKDFAPGTACLDGVQRHLEAPRADAVEELRGAVYLARILKRVDDIPLLIKLLERNLDRGTRMRVAAALATITLDERFGTDAARWKGWAKKVLRPGMTREQLLEANRLAIFDTTASFLVREIKSTVTALGDKAIERLSGFFTTPYPKVTVAAAEQVGELYGAITDEASRRSVQAKVLPMLLALFGHHREEVVVAAVNAVGRLSKPDPGAEPICDRVRTALVGLIEDGTPALQARAVAALQGFADPKASRVAARLQAVLEACTARPAEFRVALVNALGAFRPRPSVALFKRLTEADPDERVRIAAATNYLRVAPDEAIATLSGILGEAGTSATLRRRFAVELGNVITKHPAVIRPLVARLRGDTDLRVQVICADSLGYAQGEGYVQEAGAALHERLKASPAGLDPKLAAALATSLGELGHAPAVPDLIALARRSDAELRARTEAALVKIAVHDVKRTRTIAAQLLAGRLPATVVTAYRTLLGDAEKAKRLNEQAKAYRDDLAVLYVRGLMATEDPKNLKAAETEVQKLRRPRPNDAELMLLMARILHLGGVPRAAEARKFLTDNRPPSTAKAVQREWNVLGAWAQVRLGRKDAANLFKSIYSNGEAPPQDPLYWEYLVGYALALVQQDVKANRPRIEALLEKLPREAFDSKAPGWLKIRLEDVEGALKQPVRKAPRKPPKPDGSGRRAKPGERR